MRVPAEPKDATEIGASTAQLLFVELAVVAFVIHVACATHVPVPPTAVQSCKMKVSVGVCTAAVVKTPCPCTINAWPVVKELLKNPAARGISIKMVAALGLVAVTAVMLPAVMPE